MKKKAVSLLSVGALTLGLLAPTAAAQTTSDSEVASKYQNFDTERYTDRVDVDGYLDKLANDEEFQKKAKKKIKENAEDVNFNEEKGEESESSDGNFTYNGGTKQFLDYELGFKEFTLRSEGDHVEIWVANNLSYPDDRPDPVVTQEQVDKLAEEFDSNIYPTDTGFFGTPDSHDGTNALLEDLGIVPDNYYKGDGDKIIMLVDNVKDENYYDPTYPFFVAGFYWSTLEQYTDRNIITIDTNNWEERLENTFYGTTIHELQHLIHDDNDSDETTWVNEGMSTFSEFLGGYGLDTGSINFLLDHPENSLTAWDEWYSAETGPETIADYALVQLWTLYNYEQFGQEFIREVATSPTNSIDSYNEALENNGINMDFQDVYKRFSSALLLDDDKRKGGVYGFENIDLKDIPVSGQDEPRGKTVDFESAKVYEKEGVPAWGGDYKKLDFDQKIDTIEFSGQDFFETKWQSVEDPLGSGNQVFWGNEGNEADHNMIFEADLSNVSDATLTFDNYIDIEEQWDFGMVQVSTDGGQTWNSLENENTRSDVVENGYPKIKENVPGFTGTYEDWQTETFDLSEYAGQEVLISFRYLTDWASNNSGWFVDNIEIPEIGLTYDGSSVDEMQSLSEVQQEYVEYGVSFINKKKNGNYKVIHVDPFNVTDEDALKLRQLFRKGENYMHTYYAAPQDSLDSVNFEYEVKFKDNNGKGHKNK
ncbi:peptidase M6 [Virgibacillus sp. MSP4-1]|uniref:immune inhibitor A domain-containing protein n=1 Tax=Virgibacillus sp. MSP4-1 TaxID=2700081 RepID=UPI0003A83CF3|nr:immune inhibitor A domain-containing protein [Virgibacillus sp. MSP4-1]QHS23626.1 peptidase M6 [Virgibacillus sp. MSP4-1]